ncbi:MAG TPA: hypothetical protein VIE43_22585 [Thermoanaerobaculia bacterium]|nr:hypothetical protein [Thermoanaerobaculia bacterium]
MTRKLWVAGFALFAVLIGSVIPARAEAVKGETEVLAGFDLDLLAKALCQLTTLRTQYGEKDGKFRFDAWLKNQGSARPQFDASYGAWWRRFKADSTGQLEARFNLLNSKCANEANFGDVPSHAKEVREGITLEQYAKISVALSRKPGAGLDKVLRQNGIDSPSRWQRVNEAWGKAMHDDATLGLVQQYAALYQKYAGPAFEKEQQDKTAAILAAHNREASPPPPPRTGPLTLADLQPKLGARSPAERWSAARQIALQCSLWSGPARKDAGDPRAPYCSSQALHQRLLPVILDAVDHHDDDTLNYGTNMLDLAGELGLKDATFKAAVERALKRDQDRLTALEAAFAPIQNKAVPERVALRSKINGYQAAVRDFKAALADW